MAYTPVSERNVIVKRKYIPVAERVEKPSLQSFFPVKQQIQELSKPVTTRPMTLKEVDTSAKQQMQQDITKLSQRDMSKDVISAGKPEETSFLRKIIKATPTNLGFEKNVFDPLAKVAKFIFPSKDDYLREAVEENPKLSMDEVSKRANELMLKDGFIDTGGGNMISPLDMVSGSGVMGTTKIVPGIKRAVRKILEASSEDDAKKIALELTPNASTAEKFVADILKAKTEQEAETVLNNIDKQISKPKYIPVKDRVAKVPESDAQIIDSAKESILSRFDEPVPIVTGKKQPNILGIDDKVKDDYLEFLKAEKAPTVQDINRGLELLRLDGKNVDDIATELTQIGKVPESKVDLVEEAKKFDNGADFYNYSTSGIRDSMNEIGVRGKEQFENWFNKNIKIGQKDYTMSHRPTETGATADNISQEVSDMGFPNDFYEHPEYYANLKDKSDIESWNVLKKIKGKPDREITIYRASPKNELNRGDWVTLSKSYAKQESLAEGTPVNSFKVKAKDIQFAGDSINEFGYYPKTTTNTKLQAFKAGKPNLQGGYIANPFGKVPEVKTEEFVKAHENEIKNTLFRWTTEDGGTQIVKDFQDGKVTKDTQNLLYAFIEKGSNPEKYTYRPENEMDGLARIITEKHPQGAFQKNLSGADLYRIFGRDVEAAEKWIKGEKDLGLVESKIYSAFTGLDRNIVLKEFKQFISKRGKPREGSKTLQIFTKANLKPGQEITYNRPISTFLERFRTYDYEEEYLSHTFGENKIIIEPPKETDTLIDLRGFGQYQREREVLLPPGTTIKVKEIVGNNIYADVNIPTKAELIRNYKLKTRTQLEDIWKQANGKTGSSALLEEAKGKGRSEFVFSPKFEYHLSTSPNLKEGAYFADLPKAKDAGARGGGGESIFTTKNPQAWHSQLAFEQNAETPNHVYLVEVKNPNMQRMQIEGSIPVDLQTVSNPNEVRILKKLGTVPNNKSLEAGLFESEKNKYLEDIWKQANQPTNTKLQAFKAGKPNLQGGYIANPFQGKPKQLVDNQGVSSNKITTQKKPERVVIDAELKEIKQAVLNKETTENQIDELSNRLGIAESTLDASPAKGLVKYKSKTTGRLPEVTGKDTMKSLTGSGKVVKTSEFGVRGDDIITELGFKDVDDAQKALDNYLLQKENIKELRDLMRTQKASRALANKVGKVVRVATASRRHFVNELLDQFQLPESSVKSLIGGRDFRLMSQSEFDEFVVKLEQRAVEHFDKRQAKAELVDLLERRHFQKVENYRKAMQLPTVENMSAKQLREYADALEQFQTGDEFLTTRQLEVVDRGDLKGIKTFREAKEKLLEQIRKTKGMEDITLDDLNVTPSALDNLSFDTALAERNPYYNFIVNRTQTHILNGEKHFIEVQNKVNDLAKKAKASRDRGVIGSIKQALIPQYDEIVKYLEAPMDEKAIFAKALTKEELDYANYIQQYYSQAYDHLVKIKELYGSRYVDQYFTHTRKQFLEEWSDNGIISAFKNWYSSYKEDEMVANILDQSTGEILPKSKFFQYTLQRTGGLEPSKNVTRVFLQYARAFERKKMFDEMIPELDIYTQSLTPKELTPRGLEMDRRLKTFVNKYLNTKKGRLENVGGVIKQNGPADMFLRMGNTFVSLYDLGLSIGASLASLIGEQVMTYQALGKIRYAKGWKNRIWDTGVKRLSDKNANKILKEAEPFIGRNIWTELAEADKGLGERAMQSIFGVFHQSSVEANKIFLLGSLSKEEIAKGAISPQKMAELRLEAGRWRDMGKDVKSILGATSSGQTFTKYKGWAIPIARTNIKNITELTKKISSGDFKGAISSREFAETYRAIEMSTVLVLVGSYILSKDEEDTFIGRMKARAYQETMTLLGGTDPTVFLATPRLVSYLQQLAGNLKKLVLLEENEEGELKGVKGLEKQITPAVIRQFDNKETEEESMLPELPKLPKPKLPQLPTLP